MPPVWGAVREIISLLTVQHRFKNYKLLYASHVESSQKKMIAVSGVSRTPPEVAKISVFR